MTEEQRRPIPGAKNVKALHGALEHSVTLQRERLQQILDEYVGNGALSRTDAERLLGTMVEAGKGYSQALLTVLDRVPVAGPVASRVTGKVGGVVAGATGRLTGAVRRTDSADSPDSPE